MSEARADAIAWLVEKGITTGKETDKDGNPTFHPQDVVTRGAMAEFLYKLAKSPTYTNDTLNSKDSTKGLTKARIIAINWLIDTAITVKDINDKFNPDDPVTRGAMAEFLQKFVGSTNEKYSISSFIDVSRDSILVKYSDSKKKTRIAGLSENRMKAIIWLYNQRITAGVEFGTVFTPDQRNISGWKSKNGYVYRPTDFVTRGSMAEFLYKLENTFSLSQIFNLLEKIEVNTNIVHDVGLDSLYSQIMSGDCSSILGYYDRRNRVNLDPELPYDGTSYPFGYYTQLRGNCSVDHGEDDFVLAFGSYSGPNYVKVRGIPVAGVSSKASLINSGGNGIVLILTPQFIGATRFMGNYSALIIYPPGVDTAWGGGDISRVRILFIEKDTVIDSNLSENVMYKCDSWSKENGCVINW
ncbi:MAG: S-layer homology domain-containing protein [Bifidobacteriaceae bacterium]|nr:S-layer homology domain-containing protein [Bifidobacteriaceae bacterium]